MRKRVIILVGLLLSVLANPGFVKAQDLLDFDEDYLVQQFGKFFQFDGNKKKSVKTKAKSTKNTYMKLTNTGKKFSSGAWNGLFKLKLEYIENGRSVGSILVVSGTRKNQFFRTGEDSRYKSYEPLPEGLWFIYDINFAGKRNVYERVSFGDGFGPVIIPLRYVSPGNTSRKSILIHLDSNASKKPGTAGCIGVESVSDLQKLIGWLRKTDPRDLYVDYGLGSIRLPK
ncbi:MAG TPA: L,D-transpeptidase family protein [Pyrinomonadaceae bacterium]|nr:L,D-transpeptidase family protein [Pyrinomonadaceae bacterium]